MAGLYFMERGYADLDAQGCAAILDGYIEHLVRVPNFNLLIIQEYKGEIRMYTNNDIERRILAENTEYSPNPRIPLVRRRGKNKTNNSGCIVCGSTKDCHTYYFYPAQLISSNTEYGRRKMTTTSAYRVYNPVAGRLCKKCIFTKFKYMAAVAIVLVLLGIALAYPTLMYARNNSGEIKPFIFFSLAPATVGFVLLMICMEKRSGRSDIDDDGDRLLIRILKYAYPRYSRYFTSSEFLKLK